MANSRQRRMLGSLALLALAAGGAGAAAYFGVYKAEEAETARKEADEKALAFDAGKLQRLVLTTGEGVVRLERANDLWRIVAPIEAPADPEGALAPAMSVHPPPIRTGPLSGLTSSASPRRARPSPLPP